MILQTAKWIANIRFHRSCGKLQNKLPYNLCNSVVIVISGCDVVSVGGNFGKRVCHDGTDVRSLQHRNIILGITGCNGVGKRDSKVIAHPFYCKSLGNTGRNNLKQNIAGEKAFQNTGIMCLKLLLKSEQLLWAGDSQHFVRNKITDFFNGRNDRPWKQCRSSIFTQLRRFIF